MGRAWKFKISKYIAYCVNGGLLNGKFGIRDIVEEIRSENDVNKKEILMKVIDYLLYLSP